MNDLFIGYAKIERKFAKIKSFRGLKNRMELTQNIPRLIYQVFYISGGNLASRPRDRGFKSQPPFELPSQPSGKT